MVTSMQVLRRIQIHRLAGEGWLAPSRLATNRCPRLRGVTRFAKCPTGLSVGL